MVIRDDVLLALGNRLWMGEERMEFMFSLRAGFYFHIGPLFSY